MCATGNEKTISWLSVSLLHFCSWPWGGIPLWSLSLLFPPSYPGFRKWAAAWRGNKQRLLGWILFVICLSLSVYVSVWDRRREKFYFYTVHHMRQNFLSSALISMQEKHHKSRTERNMSWDDCQLLYSGWTDFTVFTPYTLISYNIKTT